MLCNITASKPPIVPVSFPRADFIFYSQIMKVYFEGMLMTRNHILWTFAHNKFNNPISDFSWKIRIVAIMLRAETWCDDIVQLMQF